MESEVAFQKLKSFIDQLIRVTDDEWAAHKSLLRHEQVERGGFLLRPGQVCERVSFVAGGLVRSYKTIRDQDCTMFFAFTGDYVTDYSSFLTRTPSDTYLQALEPTDVVHLYYGDMQTGYEQYPVWQKYGRLIAEHIYILLAQRTNQLQTLSPEELYQTMLKETPRILEQVPQHYIASYLGIQPESLSRIRKRMMNKDSKSYRD
jgi:CRP-like cAMP-binding protein